MDDQTHDSAEAVDAATLQAAEEFLRAGNAPAAMELLRQLASKATDGEALDFERDGVLCVRLLTMEEFVHYTQWIRSNEKSDRPRRVNWVPSVYAIALWELGCLCVEAGHPEEAIQHLERAARILPRSPHIRTEMAYCHAMMGDHATALAIYEAIPDLGPFVTASQRAMALRGIGAQLTELKRYDEALKAYADSLQYEPSELAAREMQYVRALMDGASPVPMVPVRASGRVQCRSCRRTIQQGFCGSQNGMVFYLCDDCERRSRPRPWQFWRRRDRGLTRIQAIGDESDPPPAT